ncbi:unnamed protein product [Rhizophagus irregularis]|uniref:PB1 domain-containing protein n=1 Tax=Rhizophagus irregularis TaxID=588596 RepID=A0A2N1P113_9GLOM|nr:hypothetical protein RhiirC2_726128 [Rhizophagus irregularis]CAB4386066.1 unnamed protein product [Rhizophagus irregularis]CAB5374105.1 unnamed protein product [Rhizophagus irregularis]
MTSIKVAYQSTVRRFPIPNNITWLDLESKIQELFSLPSTSKFSLSYTDDEGDVIILSTDLELQELLSSNSMLKFVLIPDEQQPLVANTFSSNTSENEFITVEKEKPIPDNVSEKMDINDAADEPSFKPTIPSISKGKQKEESPAESSTSKHQQEENQPSSDNNEQRAPFIELAEQFQELIDQFKDVFSKNPQLTDQANNVMDQILRNVPVDINQWAQWLNTFRPEGDDQTTNAQRDESNNSQHQHHNQQGGFPSFFPPPHSLLSNPYIQRIFQDINANYPRGFGNFENFARPTGFNGPWNFNGGCPYRQQQREELSQEELKEKINLLHSMGFWEDDVKNEELLKRYNGNIERVIEILIREQTERVNNNFYNSMENVVDSQ